MPKRRFDEVTRRLRSRLLDGVDGGLLHVGDRLPGTRALSRDLRADPRVVAGALRQLAREGIVEIRARSGTYVTARAGHDEEAIGAEWMVDVLTTAVARGVRAQSLGTVFADVARGAGVRATVTAATADQIAGILRELRQDFGISATAVAPEQLIGRIPAPIERANLLITTETHAPALRKLAARLGKRIVVVQVRADLFDAEWLSLLERDVFVVTADDRFHRVLREYLETVPHASNVTMLVAGRDDLKRIPDGAPTYVTESARRILRGSQLPGRVMRPRRLFAESTVRELAGVLVERAIRAHARRRRTTT